MLSSWAEKLSGRAGKRARKVLRFAFYASPGIPFLPCRSRPPHILNCGRQLATAEARLYGPDGTLYAHATTTCLVFELPSPK